VPKRFLEEQLFGQSEDHGGPNAIEVYVYRLRQLLAEWGAEVVIHTVRGVGYLIPTKADGGNYR
jgi:DNA-binding response OmpR family regulator